MLSYGICKMFERLFSLGTCYFDQTTCHIFLTEGFEFSIPYKLSSLVKKTMSHSFTIRYQRSDKVPQKAFEACVFRTSHKQMRDNSKIAKDLFDARASCKHFGIFLVQSRSFCLFSRKREASKYHVRHSLKFQISCTKNILYWHTHPRKMFLCKYWADAESLSHLIDLKKINKANKRRHKCAF